MSDMEFRDRKNYPGLEGGPFEIFVRAGELVENLPSYVFGVLLLLLAIGICRGQWMEAFILWVFFTTDWILISLLPRARISFGPSKPPTLMLAFLRLPFALLPLPWMILLQGVGTIFVIYGFWIEPQRMVLTHQKIASPQISSKKPLRIVHFGDIHLERMTRRDEKIVPTIHNLSPDLILFSGDLLSYSNVNDPVSWIEIREIFKRLSAPLGVLIVRGTPLIDRPDNVKAMLDGLPVRVLEEEKIQLDYNGTSIQVIGISCSHKPYIDGEKLCLIVDKGEDAFKILLYHSPDLAPIAAENGIDLQLSGHTHGGQVRLPVYGALYTSSLYGKQFESGRYTVGEMTLYVTRGIGMEGKAAPRVRFLCPPEIAVLDLSSSDAGIL